jgi:hypothetical protein
MGKSQDPGSGINIPDPQHWLLHLTTIPTGSDNVQEEENRMEGEEVECLLQTSTFPVGVFMAIGRDMEQAKNEAAR